MKFLKQLQLELRFIFKNWFFIAAPLIYLLSIYLYQTNQGYYQLTSTYFQRTSEFLSIGHTLSLGVIFLGSVLAIRREKQTVLLDWTNSLPNSHFSIILAKYLAIYLYSLIFTLLFAISFVAFGMAYAQPSSYLMEHTLNFSLQSQLSYGISIALGMILAVLISNRIVYIIVFCAWMFGTFFMEGFIILKYNFFFLKTFHLNQFFLDSHHSDSWGYILEQREKRYSQFFVFTFSLLLLMLTILKSSLHRLSSHKKKAWISVGAVSIICIATFFPYSSLWKERLLHYEALKTSASEKTNFDELSFFDVTDYMIDVERVGNSTIAVQSQLTIPAQQKNELIFVLYPTFEIDSIYWNDAPVDYKREQHKITLANLDQLDSNQLTVSYNGSLNEWGTIYSREKNFAFLYKDEMFFPSNIGWYPIPGNYPLYEHINNEHEEFLHTSLYRRNQLLNQKLPRSNFAIELKGFNQKVLATSHEYNTLSNGTQIFRSTEAKGVTLLSRQGLAELETDFPFKIISHVDKHGEFQEAFAEIHGIQDYLTDWTARPVNQNLIIAYIPSLQYVGLNMYEFNSMDEAIFFDANARSFHYIDSGKLIDNTMLSLKAQVISYLLFDSDITHSYYHYEEHSVMDSFIQAVLLVIYMDYLEYEWADFQQFNGTMFYNLSLIGDLRWVVPEEEGWSTSKKLGYLMRSHSKQDRPVFMVAKEIEEGKTEKVKELLVKIMKDIHSSDKKQLSYEEWMNYWNSTFEGGEMN